MKYIRLYAYLYHNLGDDLMVEVLLKRYPNCRFYCDCDMPIRNKRLVAFNNFVDKEKLYEKYGRLNRLFDILSFGRQGGSFFSKLFRKYEQRCKASVYIGGSLYIPRQGESLEDRILRENRKFAQEPLYIIGANFGNEDTMYENAFFQYFSRCAGVSFRDKTSYDKFSQLPHTQYTSDVVFNLDVSEYNINSSDGTVLISVIDLYAKKVIEKTAGDYDRFVVKLCEESVKRGKRPVLVSFCKAEGDEMAIERIFEQLASSVQQKTSKLYYDNNASEILRAFAGAEHIIATRFHAMILALKMKKPFFCVSYNEKLKQVLKDLGNDQYAEPGNLECLDIERCFNRDDSKYTELVEEYIRQAEKQFSQFDSYIAE